MSKFLLKLDEYNRIHQVVHGVVKDEGDAGRACTFFAMIGSLILNKHYGIAARPVAGAFLLCVEPGKNVVYGRDDGGKIGFDQDAFHMWVQTETHIIDFMAPIFRESFAAAQPDIVIPRKMFQKRISVSADGTRPCQFQGGDGVREATGGLASGYRAVKRASFERSARRCGARSSGAPPPLE